MLSTIKPPSVNRRRVRPRMKVNVVAVLCQPPAVISAERTRAEDGDGGGVGYASADFSQLVLP